jgi:hypothetical protein
MTVFDAQVQTRLFSADGDTQVVCPQCKRSYVHHDSWSPIDRVS